MSHPRPIDSAVMKAVEEQAVAPSPQMEWNVQAVRRNFPALHQRVNGVPLAYLDNAAMAKKPRVVIHAVSRYYQEDDANVCRGVQVLAERATAAYEGAREGARAKARHVLNARAVREIVFPRGTTEAINLVRTAWGRVGGQGTRSC